jgi:hypothetical protein
MALRTGIYIVPTDRWYIERTVWLVAGLFLLGFTVLAAWHRPQWAFAIMGLAATSIAVSLTGFCVVGNVLKLLGFTAALGRPGPTPGGLYFMQTDRWYLERRIYLVVGCNLIAASTLSLLHSAWWLAFPAFVGLAMLVFAATGFCIMANSLYWMGAEPRLVPEGRAVPLAVDARQREAV